MKKLKVILSLFTVLALASCTGDRGPMGPPGGVVFGKILEIEGDFTQANDFSITYNFPKDVVVYESDAILVYLLEGQTQYKDDIWTPLPQTYFIDRSGIMIYSYNHTYRDVAIFLDADFPLVNLPSGFTRNQVFRIAIVPMEYADAGLSMEELMDSGNVKWISQ